MLALFKIASDSKKAIDHIEIVNADDQSNIAAGLEAFGLSFYKVMAKGLKKNFHIISDIDVDLDDIHDILCEVVSVDPDSDISIEKVKPEHRGCKRCDG